MNKEEINLYKILEVEIDASDIQIKKSYRKLALKYHPDKNNNNSEKFLQIQYAYEILYKKKNKNLNNKIDFDDWLVKYLKNTEYIKLYELLKIKLNNITIEKIFNFNNIIKTTTSLLDIEITIHYNLEELYNNIEKKIEIKRITKDIFIEYIYPIDKNQTYENDGEKIVIDNISMEGNLVVNIQIDNCIEYKNYIYTLVGNDIYIKINKLNIVNNEFSICFLDNKIYNYNMNLLKLKEYNTLLIHKIKNMGLNYYNTDKDIIDIKNIKIKRGNLFYIFY